MPAHDAPRRASEAGRRWPLPTDATVRGEGARRTVNAVCFAERPARHAAVHHGRACINDFDMRWLNEVVLHPE
jgi:hypothetical protein